jgi:hypothetical protein
VRYDVAFGDELVFNCSPDGRDLELTDEEYAEYLAVEEAWERWQERLASAVGWER